MSVALCRRASLQVQPVPAASRPSQTRFLNLFILKLISFQFMIIFLGIQLELLVNFYVNITDSVPRHIEPYGRRMR